MGLLIGAVKFFAVTYRYNFWVPVLIENDRTNIALSLGVRSVPTGYVLRATDTGAIGENTSVIYINSETGQKLILAQLREHLFDESFVLVDKSTVERTFTMESVRNPEVPLFQVTYLLPTFSRRDDLEGIGSEAIIKGVRLQAEDRFETEATDVVYFKGEFEKIGLFKKEERGEWRYPVPVFDFTALHEGALAFVTSKASGRAVVCIGVNSLGQFRENEFKDFLRTLQPSAEPIGDWGSVY